MATPTCTFDIEPGNQTLKQRLLVLGAALGMVADQADCDGALGQDIMRYNVTTAVIDDHVHPHALGIPSVNLMDPVYGEPKSGTFGSYWHTMEDTPDKVSAESLERVGRLVEVALELVHCWMLTPRNNPNQTIPTPHQPIPKPRPHQHGTADFWRLASLVCF